MIRHDMTAWIVLVSEAERTNAMHGCIKKLNNAGQQLCYTELGLAKISIYI